MTYEHDTENSAACAEDKAFDALLQARRRGAYPLVWLAPHEEGVERVRRRLSATPLGFSVGVATFEQWAADQWELHGDGTRPVDALERSCLLWRVVAAGPWAEAGASFKGVVALLAQAVSQGVRAQDFDGVALSASQQGLVASLARYQAELDRRGRCELSWAMRDLAGLMAFQGCVAAVGFDELPWVQSELLRRLGASGEALRIDDGCRAASRPDGGVDRAPELSALLAGLYGRADAPVAPTGAVSFLLPQGSYGLGGPLATRIAALACAEADAARAAGRRPLPVVVCAPDARDLFLRLGPELARRGVASQTRGRASCVAFASTVFGKAWLSLAACADQGARTLATLSDVLRSPLCPIDDGKAMDFDAAWRKRRLRPFDDMVADVASRDGFAATLVSLAMEHDFEGALAVLEPRLRSGAFGDAALQGESVAAFAALGRFLAAWRDCGGGDDVAWSLVAQRQVASPLAFSAEEGVAGQGDALFCSLSDAARLAPASACAVVLCDMTAQAYPVRVEETPATLLLERIGVVCDLDPVAQMRRSLFRCLSAASTSVLLERPLFDEDGTETYPCLAFEEIVDCYRPYDALDRTVDRATGLPPAVARFASVVPETHVHENLLGEDVALTGPGQASSWPAGSPAKVSPEGTSSLVGGAFGGDGAHGGGAVVLSPSAVETYLECPLKWFTLRRLRLKTPDAGFGPMEKGSFAHDVLRRFYEQLHKQGVAKVAADDVARAQALMEAVADEELARQPALPSSRNPLVAVTAAEEAEVRHLKRQLVGFVPWEAQLLAGFVPTHFEYGFGKKTPFSYAGVHLTGSIDRIDVNDKGQAVVIDYKSSVKGTYDVRSRSSAPQAGGAVLPDKVQALMYAQVARRELGLDVVGALYVGYQPRAGKPPALSGAFDRTAIQPSQVWDARAELVGYPQLDDDECAAYGASSFAELVDEVERGVEGAVASLCEGRIAPYPRTADACSFCPVQDCAKRRD
ncbi:PD-(D/E)XK nuclease family protein [Eggerthellaceae bacterium zg-887]|uniref:PD-(D/E)XK nuclease family protein n=1 Tax=Xiamenia xianingshaonis TaxID=2682776 RepID=UPI0014081B32|nr:PD-(D/E)XK nuclease family protein [Xiamenia xianingshaonis]NHM15946.1 PD-(D/E)XK nuclease family protein [Xiamenia xianingshaonis]